MTGTVGSLRSKRSSQRAKTPGWATFDLLQRQNQVETPKEDLDPFPPLPSSSSSSPVNGGLNRASATGRNLLKQKNANSNAVRCEDISFMSVNSRVKSCAPAKSFASVVEKFTIQPDAAHVSCKEPRMDHSNTDLTSREKLGGVMVPTDQKHVAVEKLKILCDWADESLIEDVLMAVDYDHEQASASLDSMAATNSLGNLHLTDLDEAVEDPPSHEIAGENCYTLSNCPGFEDVHGTNTINHLPTAPLEPEWEEDDIYLKHRKDALRMLRTACRHSRDAENAFLRGDHRMARIMSVKAREEHLAADKLNAEAAAEILRIRNEKHNDIWKLDLHGLHASEAVCALESHLEIIEYDISNKTSVSSGAIMDKKVDDDPSSSNQASSKSEKTEKQTDEHGQKQFPGVLSLHTWKPSELQVITGAGAHSRGGAALPIAIKSFLIDKGYKFNDIRTGVIAVRPKFRYN